MYNNQQYNQSYNYSAPSNYYVGVSQPPKPQNNRAKIFVIGLIVLSVIGFIALIAFLINKNQSSPINEGRDVTPTLEIYASLTDGIPLENVEAIAKGIDEKAEVTMAEGFGVIKIPDTTESIIFYYLDDENNETAEAEPTSDESTGTEESLDADEVQNIGFDLNDTEGLEEPTKSYKKNRAYDFSYLLEMGEYNIYISGDEDSSFHYYDGVNIFDAPTKEEAIQIYLAPTVD